METDLIDSEWGSDDVILERDGMKGGADPLLSQEPASVLPSYQSLMDTDSGHDFSDDKLMKSGRLYSLYLLNSEQEDKGEDTKVPNGQHHLTNTPDDDALFEGMPFYEIKGKEIGPCAYCNMWRSVHFISYCRRYPFCSVSCTKKFAVCKKEKGELQEKSPEHSPYAKNLQVPTLFPQHRPKPLFPAHECETKVVPVVNQNGLHTFSWTNYLESEGVEAAPIKCFHHAPMFKEWKSSMLSALIEVNNRDGGDDKDYFWIARIVRVAGYKALLRFEGYGIDSSHDFWVHLCKIECYPINGAEKAGKKLKPPKDLMEKIGSNWLEFVNKVAHQGAPTIQISKELIKEELKSPFELNMRLEAVYKRLISSTCTASIKTIVSNRLQVQYENIDDPNRDFWFNSSSPLIHPIGWSRSVGHPLIDTSAYKTEALDRGRILIDAPPHLFKDLPLVGENHTFHNGMKLEAVDPLKLGNICVATIMYVLGDGYLMVQIDTMPDQPRNEPFCYHSSSSSILPVGFCDYHKIELVPPIGYTDIFDWDDYLRRTNSLAAPVELFEQDVTNPGWKPGHKVEAVDLIESSFICVGTITKIAGPLIQVHFDGWDSSYDQWVDMHSQDVYPVGWCELTDYPLQPPKTSEKMEYSPPVPVLPPSAAKKRKSATTVPKKKKLNENNLNKQKKVVPVDIGKAEAIYRFSDDDDLCVPISTTISHLEKKKPLEKKITDDKKSSTDKKSLTSKKPSEKKKVDKVDKKLDKDKFKKKKNLKLKICMDNATEKTKNNLKMMPPDVLEILSKLKKEPSAHTPVQIDEMVRAQVRSSIFGNSSSPVIPLTSALPANSIVPALPANSSVPRLDQPVPSSLAPVQPSFSMAQLKQHPNPGHLSHPPKTSVKMEVVSQSSISPVPSIKLTPTVDNIPHLDLNSTSQGALLQQIALSNKSKTKPKQRIRNGSGHGPKKSNSKAKGKKTNSLPNSPTSKTSHLATLLNLPGQIDLTKLEPHIYNGFLEPRSKFRSKNDSLSLSDESRERSRHSDLVQAFAQNNLAVSPLLHKQNDVTSPPNQASVLTQSISHSVHLHSVGIHSSSIAFSNAGPIQENGIIADQEKRQQQSVPMTPPLPSPVQNSLRPELPPFASLTQHWRGSSEPMAVWATSPVSKTMSSSCKAVGDPMTPAPSPTSTPSLHVSLSPTQYSNAPISFPAQPHPSSPYMLVPIPASQDGKPFAMKTINMTQKHLQMIEQQKLQSLKNLVTSPNASPQHSFHSSVPIGHSLMNVPSENVQMMPVPRLMTTNMKGSSGSFSPSNYPVQYARLAHNSTAGGPSTPLHAQPQQLERREEVRDKSVRSPNFDPWKWSVPAVVQFLIDAGEGSCADTFRRQKIDGLKFMSLTKDQIAKLTGMKVAPSLKIYHQIELLRSHYPSPST
ncbi:uncharacterized protein LOC117108118 [Anneissia japonica]|uniref:uncharacterized protein LOC117108118 n=1 Tax=Anneissia japonica TaxID=1529436 RepID=UPI0014259545|nr:uncharacterized protein LOC117108118 [Anneissia japonica]